jgi:cytosine/adenosine deaminase-related metal-dependent hydrolase
MSDDHRKADPMMAGGHVVTVDPQWSEHRDGAVAISQRRIVAVGSRTDLLERLEASETIDARGCLVLPGLSDAHLHTAYSVVSHLTAKSDWTKLGPFALGGDIAGFLSLYGRLDRADEIGSLEPGKRADLTVIRCNDARWAVYPDSLVGFCRTGCPGDIDTVVVDGKVLVRKGEIVGMDACDVIASATAAMASFVSRNF